MKISKNKLQISLLILSLIASGVFMMTLEKTEVFSLKPAHNELSGSASLSSFAKDGKNSMTEIKAASSALILVPRKSVSDFSSEDTMSMQTYFNEVLAKNPQILSLYTVARQKLPASRASDLIAMYIAEGLGRTDSSGFMAFMKELQTELNSSADEVADVLISENETFREDPFAYQMILNLAPTLNISPEKKLQILGKGLDAEYKLNDQSMASANITNALILMKNTGVSSAQAKPFIHAGLEKNKSNPAAMEEFAVRAATYYPDLFYTNN